LTHYRKQKEILKQNEGFIHIDFAENYQTKLGKEIQSMHFGASHAQITLHTGISYNGTDAKVKSFCTVSESMDHSPCAVWAYLNPVLDEMQRENETLDTLHIFSDGPATQYKQKGNFYLFSTQLVKRGIKYATWNFHESGHGKGAPDGIGGVLKRTANAKVLQGHDIPDAKSFLQILQNEELNISLYYVPPKDIDLLKETMPLLKAVPNTMRLHQIITDRFGEIFCRDVSCSCTAGNEHQGHALKKFVFKTNQKSTLQPNMKAEKAPPVPKTHERESDNIEKISSSRRETETDDFGAASMRNESFEDVKEDLRYGSDAHSRSAFFENVLFTLGKLKTFDEIHRYCLNHENKLAAYKIARSTPSIVGTGLTVDEDASNLYPADVEQSSVIYPVAVTGDGNCLPYTGSVLAFGQENHGKEMRVRIVFELAIHKDLYLSKEHLRKGLDDNGTVNDLSVAFAMYSEKYIPGILLNKETVAEIYHSEVIDACNDKRYMGIWQIFALSSVLGNPLFSVYPQRGNTNVRKDLHRLIMPRSVCSGAIQYIMWTSTRKDMIDMHWIPNHFVPVLPIEAARAPTQIEIQRWRLMYQRKQEREKMAKKAKEENEENKTEIMANPEVVEEKCNTQTENENNHVNETEQASDETDLEPENLLNKYVVVLYDNQP
jgi:hypothetical protein